MDGTCSAAIMYMFCRAFLMDVNIYFHSGKQHGLHDKVDEIIKLITSIAKTGEVGDGKIFVSDVCNCIRIRTGEEGPDAL